jgi:hypothetical protein
MKLVDIPGIKRGYIHNMKIDDESFEHAAKLRYFGTVIFTNKCTQ